VWQVLCTQQLNTQSFQHKRNNLEVLVVFVISPSQNTSKLVYSAINDGLRSTREDYRSLLLLIIRAITRHFLPPKSIDLHEYTWTNVYFLHFIQSPQQAVWTHHTFVVSYNTVWLIKPSSGSWLFFYSHLYSPASIPTISSVYTLEYCFL
jgi:hypothetical protein